MTIELRGTETNDQIDFLTADTNVEAGDGNDTVTSVAWDAKLGKFVRSPGNNRLDGGAGNDTLHGSLGHDTLIGGTGNDSLYASYGAADMDGGDGNDIISAQYYDYDKSLWAISTGNHTMRGGAGDDRIFGGDGNETLFGGSGSNTIDGGNGNDVLDVSASSVRNVLYGGTGNNTIVGGAGADDIYSGNGSAVVDGGDGNDNIFPAHYDFAINQWIVSNLSSTLNGGAGDDSIRGGNADDLIDGGSGNDMIDAGAGNDSLSGGSGNDLIDAGAGNDTLNGGLGNDSLYGGLGDDYYIINNRNTTVYDSGGNSTFLIGVDWYKLEQSNKETYIFLPGVEKLPYWIDATTFVFQMAVPGQKKVINYAFADAPPERFNATDRLDFSAFTAAQKELARKTFAYVSSVVNIEFRETTDTASAQTLVLANNSQDKSAGYGGAGKLMLDNSDMNLTANPGTYAALTMIHELGHVLGLKHPFGHTDANGNIGPGPYLPDAEDSTEFTVMSYTSRPSEYGVHFSAFDIAALSFLYGPSAQVAAGDTRTVLSATSSNFITDGAGTDTLDGSAFSQALVIDLRPGYWGHIGTKTATISAAGQVTVNFGSVIENLLGGSGNDRLTGNEVDNDIHGGAGDDVLVGGLGADILRGDAGIDTASYSASFKGYALVRSGINWLVGANADANDRDTLNNVERLQFTDAVLALSSDGLAATAEQSAYTALAHKFYIAYFGRPADPAGLSSMVKQLSNAHAPSTTNSFVAAYGRDATVTSIIDSFGNSAESAALYKGGTEAFITAIYSNVLGRAPDAGGLAFWSGAVNKGEISRGQVALNILAGAEVNESQQGLLDAALANNRMLSAGNFTASLDTTREIQAYSGNAAAATMRAILEKVGASSNLLDTYRSFDTALVALASAVAIVPAVANTAGAITGAVTDTAGVAILVGNTPSWLDGLI